jgi:hypothetical protein
MPGTFGEMNVCGVWALSDQARARLSYQRHGDEHRRDCRSCGDFFRLTDIYPMLSMSADGKIPGTPILWASTRSRIP